MTTQSLHPRDSDRSVVFPHSFTGQRIIPVFSGLFLALALGGCSATNDSLWPSITPAASPTLATGKPARNPGQPTAGNLLPANAWDVAGGLALLVGFGGVVAMVWRLPAMNRRFDNLRNTYETLAKRRDKGATDLVELSLKVSVLNQQIQSLQGEIARRPAGPPDRSVAGEAAAAPQSTQPAPAATLAPAPAATPAPAPAAPAGASSRFAVDSRSFWSEGLSTEGSSTAATPPPPSPPPQLQSMTSAALAAVQGPVVTLADLVEAINGESRKPVEGISFVELAFADPPDLNLLRPGQRPPTRLRQVNGSGSFLLVMLDGDDWLFPAVATLQAADTDLAQRGLFEVCPGNVDQPRLRIPAQMREVGGLWEVTECGRIEIPG